MGFSRLKRGGSGRGKHYRPHGPEAWGRLGDSNAGRRGVAGGRPATFPIRNVRRPVDHALRRRDSLAMRAGRPAAIVPVAIPVLMEVRARRLSALVPVMAGKRRPLTSVLAAVRTRRLPMSVHVVCTVTCLL